MKWRASLTGVCNFKNPNVRILKECGHGDIDRQIDIEFINAIIVKNDNVHKSQ